MRFGKKSKPDFGQQIAPHVPAIWRFALSLSGRPDVADDLTQSTCLRALEKHHLYKDQGTLMGWLMTICRSIWLNELRAQSVRKTGGLDTAHPSELIDKKPSAEMNTFISEVFTRIMQLPEAQRATVDLVYVQNFTYSEAAQILDVPIGTIMSRLHTARAALADLKDDTPAPPERQRK
ncbi:MAG: RNA polymerase sigma factor [Sedimentitalea sp.]